MKSSDYIVFVDESGDHSLTSINPYYPMFVLAFCIFNKNEYIYNVLPSMHSFKFKHFGHDLVILHEHEIRKAKNSFAVLNYEAKHSAFISDLTLLIDAACFTIISVAIQKKLFKEQYE